MAGQLDQNSSVHNKEPSDCRILNTEGDGSTGEGQSDKPSSDSNVSMEQTKALIQLHTGYLSFAFKKILGACYEYRDG